jgi:signal transduction histidine kinase
MNDLLRDLLDLTRLELGRLSLEVAPRPVADLVAAALTTLRPAAEAKHVDLTASVADGLMASCDERRATQVITIVAANGIKYSPEGGKVTVSVEGRGADILFTVTDKGSGIAASELPKVFGPYWHGPENARRGMGVGLPLAKVIVEAHGGRIWAMSVEGEGSTFFFTLPSA